MRIALLAAVLGLSCAFVPAGALTIGDPAPALALETWVQGEAFTVAPGASRITVVEFWATWCPPCRAAIPRLIELQDKYKDVIRVVAISDEDADVVREFVKKQGDKMTYAVAIDDGEKSWEAYAKPFGLTGIPHAFIVDRNGVLVWHGHAQDDMETVITKLQDGSFDVAAEKRRAEAGKRAEDFENALALALREYVIHAKSGKADEANAAADRIMRDATEYPNVLNILAWTILEDETLQHRDLPLALRAAQRAHEITEGKDADILDTYARALFRNGKKEEAIAIQEKAVAAAAGTDQEKEYQTRLSEYRQ